MSAEIKKEIQLEIAHVLFIDIVGYSKLAINEQRALLDTLNRIVRSTEQFQSAEQAGRLIKIPTGDGMALVFYSSPEAPLECALEISRAAKEHPELKLRMGVHSGPVSGVIDVSDRANVTGAGINVAQRVMDCGDAGHILLSKHLAEDLEQYPHWRPHLHDLGECEVKHGVRVSVVNLYTDELGNSEVPEKFKQAVEASKAAAAISGLTERPTTRPWATVGAVFLIVAVVVTSLFIFLAKRAPPAPIASAAVPEKSIAVLPFENLSEEKANAYFADGIQEEVLTRLSKIADIKVISRSSTQRFKSAPDNLLEVAKQLGVANILEGSVQRSADHVRVNVQLIKAAADTHLWADTFDRKLTDVFAVESEIAAKIADTLQARLTGAEQQAIAARPTEDSEAHQLYLRGRYFSRKRTDQDLRKAIDYFTQAIGKDPNYALAYAGIADSYTLLREYLREPAAELFPKARVAAEKALALDNSLAEAHVSLGLVLYDADLNLKEAKREYERAIELNPNYADAHYFLAFNVLTPLGDFDQAIAEMKRAVELDPFSLIINTNFGAVYIMARRYPEAISQLRKAVELDPSVHHSHAFLGSALELNGQLEEAIAEFEKPHLPNEERFAVAHLGHAYALKGEREKALQLLEKMKELQQRGNTWPYGFVLLYVGLGDKDKAINWLEQIYRDKSGPIELSKVDPFLDPLRGDPRFEELVAKVFATKNGPSQ